MAFAAIIQNLNPVGPVPPPAPTFIRQGAAVGGPEGVPYDERFDEPQVSAEVTTAPISAAIATSPVEARVTTARISAVVSAGVREED